MVAYERRIIPYPMTEIHCAALLFDMDGVLINSTPAVARVWRRWAIEHGFNPEEVVARAHGRPSLTTVREYLPNADHEAENREVERREIEDLEGVIPLPGALDLLASLPSDRWTIVTSCTRPLAEVRIRAAGLPLPERLITSNDITHGKPHPEPYLKGAAVLGFPPAGMYRSRRCPRRSPRRQSCRCERHRLQNNRRGTGATRSRRRLDPEQLRRYPPARSRPGLKLALTEK